MAGVILELKISNAGMGALHRKEKCELPPEHERPSGHLISDHHKELNLRFFIFSPSTLSILHFSQD